MWWLWEIRSRYHADSMVWHEQKTMWSNCQRWEIHSNKITNDAIKCTKWLFWQGHIIIFPGRQHNTVKLKRYDPIIGTPTTFWQNCSTPDAENYLLSKITRMLYDAIPTHILQAQENNTKESKRDLGGKKEKWTTRISKRVNLLHNRYLNSAINKD